MLWRTSKLTDFQIEATDGAIGTVDDLLIDDHDWVVRWLVVDAGSWLTSRKVLLPPSSLGKPDLATGHFPVALTKQQVKDSPDIDVDQPVSRQMEDRVYSHFGWEPYWIAPWPAMPVGAGGVPPPSSAPAESDRPAGDPHLRSVRHVSGYNLHATDDDIGHVEEFLVEDGSWTVRYMIVDTRNWLPGKKVLISPRWISGVNWADRTVSVDVDRQAVKDSPEFDPDRPLDRPYEESLHRHYQRPHYWV